MSTTTTNMGLTVPTLDGDPGVWDSGLNASLALIDLHDHSTGKGVKVTPTGLNINADLTFAGYSATNLRAAVFTAQASFATALAIYVKTNDLYFRDGASNEVRLTASGALNIATTGGIAGDYIAASAQVYYDDANKTYRFLEAAPPNNWSYIACGGADLYQQGLGITNRVRLSSPNALAASYECVFPAALPADTSLLQITSAGVMTFTNTISKPVAMTSTLSVTGLITATGGLTAAANQNITVSGTGEFKHDTKYRPCSAVSGTGSGATVGDGKITSSGACTWWVPMVLEVGERLTQVDVALDGDGVATYAIDVLLVAANMTTTSLGATSGTTPNATPSIIQMASVTDTTIATRQTVVVKVTFNAANGVLGSVTPWFTRP